MREAVDNDDVKKLQSFAEKVKSTDEKMATLANVLTLESPPKKKNRKCYDNIQSNRSVHRRSPKGYRHNPRSSLDIMRKTQLTKDEAGPHIVEIS